MERIKFNQEDESWEAQRAAGRHNPGQEVVVTHGGKELRLPIGAGSSDDVTVFLHRGSTPDFDLIVVLTTHRGLGYAGLEVFRNGEASGNCFCQGEEQLTECVGPRGLDLRDYTLARRLLEYCGE